MLTRSARADQGRLEKAISKRLQHIPCCEGQPAGTTHQPACAGASSSDAAPADPQEATPDGVIKVSVDSDSDCAIPPSDEGQLSDESSDTQVGVSSVSGPADHKPVPQHSFEERTAPDGRLIIKVSLSDHQSTG